MASTDDQNSSQTSETETKSHAHKQYTNEELLTNAKVVADAAKSAISNNLDKVDKGHAAGAAAELLEAGSDYGNLEKTSYGSYVKQAEDYLHAFQSSDSKPNPASAPAQTAHEETAQDAGNSAAEPEHHSEDNSSGLGGLGGYMKMAEGFLK